MVGIRSARRLTTPPVPVLVWDLPPLLIRERWAEREGSAFDCLPASRIRPNTVFEVLPRQNTERGTRMTTFCSFFQRKRHSTGDRARRGSVADTARQVHSVKQTGNPAGCSHQSFAADRDHQRE